MTDGNERPHSTLSLGAVMAGGLFASWQWLRFSQPLVDTIQVNSIAALACLYYALVYLPLGVMALALGSLCGVVPWRAGAKPISGAANGFLIGATALALAAGLAWLNGGLVSGTKTGSGPSGLLVLGAVLILFQVFVEELLFRGWLLRTLSGPAGKGAGIVLAALASAAFDLGNTGFSLLPFANLALLGVLLGMMASRTGGIAACTAAHFGWRAMEDLALGLNPNPGTGPFDAILDLDLFGASVWGGSEAGLAASIGMAAVLAAMILFLMAGHPQRGAETLPQPNQA